ncbi:hypothetical protein AYI68_g2741 [Smittium mucronatum]|uniref:Uncharacterized protein n=1 Tax=Smittium mucronatum TaxID=133383 RepID=A0A1R0H1W6_9FUNG|nr:hypothetical protein AYI68_g2741 [Smittium mucronatum]
MSYNRRASESLGGFTFSQPINKDPSLRSIWPNDSVSFPVPNDPVAESLPNFSSIDKNVFVRRYGSLNHGLRREKTEWTAEAIIKSIFCFYLFFFLFFYEAYTFTKLYLFYEIEYPSERTIDLYDFPPEFETADINLALEKYQHGNSVRGGYRIKWLNDTRALVVFRKPDLLPIAIADFESNPLIKARVFNFKESDLHDFNRENENSSNTARKSSLSDQIPPAMNIDLEAIQKRYRPDLSLELSDFCRPMETSDLLEFLAPYRKNGHIVRIKWFNKNRAIAWFSDPILASQAVKDNANSSILSIKPYTFLPADIKSDHFNFQHLDFTQDVRISPLDNIESKNRHYPFNSGVMATRRNTVSGSSGYVRRPTLPSRLSKTFNE